jgi:hypothetical protein
VWGARDEILYLNQYKRLVYYMDTTYTLYLPYALATGTLLRFTETDTKRVALCQVSYVDDNRQGGLQYATEVTIVLGELPDQRFEGTVEIVEE